MNVTFDHKSRNLKLAVILILGFALLIKLIVAVEYTNHFDTMWYRKWALGLQDGFFDVYARTEMPGSNLDLDYPPVYLWFLWPIGRMYRLFPEALNFEPYNMFLMKLFPVLGDVACALAIYLLFRKENLKIALLGMVLWLCNPATFYSSSMWGQTDSIMCLMLLLSFYYIENGRATLGTVLFTIGALTKFQCLYFAPVVILWLIHKYNVMRFLKAAGFSALVILVVFLPFMIGSEDPLLFYRVYTKGGNMYPFYSLQAFNLFGALGLNWTHNIKDSVPLLGSITGFHVSMAVTFLIVAAVIFMHLKGKRQNIWLSGFLIMNSLFILTTRMHERYQIAVIPFIFMLWLTVGRRPFGYIFGVTSIMVFLNQAMVLLSINNDIDFLGMYDKFMVAFSTVNVLVYIAGTAYCIWYAFVEKLPESTREKTAQKQAVIS